MKHKLFAIYGLYLLLTLLPISSIRAQDTTTEAMASDYDAVAEAYHTLEENIASQGTAAIELFINQDFEALFEQFNDGMAEAVPLEELEQAYTQFSSVAALGEQTSARVLPLGNGISYLATYTWGENEMAATVTFDANNQISGLNFTANNTLPDDPALDYESDVMYQLPFEGLWYTAWGGSDRLHNYHVDAPPQRHAYDFVIWQDGSTFSGDGTSNEDYYAYGQPALAPADGTVVTIVDGLPENQPKVETDQQNPAGNHVVIQTADAEYIYIAHLQSDSISVAEGDTVEAGQEIGLVGNSGNTSEPHLHIHLQDMPEMFVTDEDGLITAFSDAIGLPLVFSNYLEDGELQESGEPDGGSFVQNAE